MDKEAVHTLFYRARVSMRNSSVHRRPLFFFRPDNDQRLHNIFIAHLPDSDLDSASSTRKRRAVDSYYVADVPKVSQKAKAVESRKKSRQKGGGGGEFSGEDYRMLKRFIKECIDDQTVILKRYIDRKLGGDDEDDAFN